MMLANPAQAAVQLQEGLDGQLVLQASATISDQGETLWQVMVYKHAKADQEGGDLTLALRPTDQAIPSSPVRVTLPDGRSFSIQPVLRGTALNQPLGTGQRYNLQQIWPHIREYQALYLTLTDLSPPVELTISPQFFQEWHTVASCQALLCTEAPPLDPRLVASP